MNRGLTIERLGRGIMAWRRLLFWLFMALTLLLSISATQLRVDAGFDKLIPLQHTYMKAFAEYRMTFGGANRFVVALVRRQGDIFDAAFLEQLKQATDAVFFTPGVDRPSVRSLFTPNARFVEVIESGFFGGDIVPATYGGTLEEVRQVRENVLKSNQIGRLVANDLGGALISADLLERDPVTGEKLDYFAVARQLESIRQQFEGDGIDVHIIGFAKAVGDIGDGARGVMAFFGIAFVITAFLLLYYARSVKLASLALVVALLPVVWLLGLLPLLGYGIDPMSVLVPFLIFSIGVSHAVQMTHAWKLAYRESGDSRDSALQAFRKLFSPGALALLANALGFLVIMLIEIEIVRELGVTASLGVALMIITNKILLPILLSWTRIERQTLTPATPGVNKRIWTQLSLLAQRQPAAWVLAVTAFIAGASFWQARSLEVGDLGTGLPELHADSRYNRDSAVITSRFAIGVNLFTIFVQTEGYEAACMDYTVMNAMDRLAERLRGVPGVHSVISLSDIARSANQALHENNPKWRQLPRHPQALGEVISVVDSSSGLLDVTCNVMQMMVYTDDHQGRTIARLVDAAKAASQDTGGARLKFLLAGGNVGVMAATNEAVAAAEYKMLVALFSAIALFCLLVFRSLGAILCIMLPLMLAAVLCNALMSLLGIGLKVSTLPVIALGVGVGVDYAIYLYGALRSSLANGASLPAAFVQAYHARGSAIAFTAVTMAVGVATWAYSALKFQADMGILLAFMFLINMVGALVLLPALAAWILPGPRRRNAMERSG
ncbi:MAG: MMPL family transporter [Candidatus Thiodiazotropha sp.]